MADHSTTADAPAPPLEAAPVGGAAEETALRKEKRKALKKLKRKQARKEAAIREREEEEARDNDPEERLRAEMRAREEAEAAEIERRAFEERERLWLEAAAARKRAEEEAAEEERRRKLLEDEQREKIDHVNESEEGDEWEYVEEGPAEIIWQGNEIIVKKKKVRVAKRSAGQQTNKEDDDRPTSNPLPPQSAAFAAYRNAPLISAQEVLESATQQIPNFGTEQDKTHCPFHLKTGACRFGSRCSRVHFYPDKSCTLLIKNMYSGPGLAWEQDEGLEFVSEVSSQGTFSWRLFWPQLRMESRAYLPSYTDEEVEHYYEEFYEDVHTEFLKFGELVNFKVCRNGSYHLRGNVYVHYKSLESAILAHNTMNGRYFAGKQITCEFVGVTRWKIAICGEYMKSRLKACSRGTACNFIHCFRNPGGDYEWADWDNPPPKHWIKKMASLFGLLDDLRYDKNGELEDWERPSDISRKRTPTQNRHWSRRSLHNEWGNRDSDSDLEDTAKHRHRSRRHLNNERSDRNSDSGQEDTDRKRHRSSIGREHSSKRRKGTDIPSKHRQSEAHCKSEVHYYEVKFSSHRCNSDEDSSKGSDRDPHKHRKFDKHNNHLVHEKHRRKHRTRERSSKREAAIDEQEKLEKKYKSKSHEWYDKDHGSDWHSDYSDDKRHPSEGRSSAKLYGRCSVDSQDRYDGGHCADDLVSVKDSFGEEGSGESKYSDERSASNRYNSHHKMNHRSDHQRDHKKSKVRKQEVVDHEFAGNESTDGWGRKRRHSGRKRSYDSSPHSRGGQSARQFDPEESENLEDLYKRRDRQHKNRSGNNRKERLCQEKIVKEDVSFSDSDDSELDRKARGTSFGSCSHVSHSGDVRSERTRRRSRDS